MLYTTGLTNPTCVKTHTRAKGNHAPHGICNHDRRPTVTVHMAQLSQAHCCSWVPLKNTHHTTQAVHAAECWLCSPATGQAAPLRQCHWHNHKGLRTLGAPSTTLLHSWPVPHRHWLVLQQAPTATHIAEPAPPSQMQGDSVTCDHPTKNVTSAISAHKTDQCNKSCSTITALHATCCPACNMCTPDVCDAASNVTPSMSSLKPSHKTDGTAAGYGSIYVPKTSTPNHSGHATQQMHESPSAAAHNMCRGLRYPHVHHLQG